MKVRFRLRLNLAEKANTSVSGIFFFFGHAFRRQISLLRLLFMHCSWIVAVIFDFSTFFSTLMGPVHCSRDPQTSLFSNFFIKNGSHNTIHTFKNYFTTVFFSFQLYPNGPLVGFTKWCYLSITIRSFYFNYLRDVNMNVSHVNAIVVSHCYWMTIGLCYL